MPYAQITVQNNHSANTLKQLRTLKLTFDHKALVDDGRSRADGRDLRVEYRNTSPDPQQHGTHQKCWVDNPNTTSCTIFWLCQSDVAASGSSTDYYLYFGDLGAVDQFPIPIFDAAWAYTYLSGFPSAPSKKQPFQMMDQFSHKPSGGSLIPYTNGDALDTNAWGYIGAFTVTDGEARIASNALGIANPMKGTSSFTTSERQSVELWTPTGVDGFVLNGITFLQSIIPSVNMWGLTSFGYNTFLIWAIVGGGALATLAIITGVPDIRDRWVPISLGMDRDTNSGQIRYIAEIDGGAYSGSYNDVSPGIFPAYTGFTVNPNTAGFTVKYRNFRWERWDGIDDADLSVSVSIPALAWPSGACEADLIENVAQLSDIWPSSRSAAVKAVPRFGSRDVGTWDVSLINMQPDVFYEMLALYKKTKGVTTFSWTPPGGSAGNYAMQHLEHSRANAVQKSITLVLEKVPA